jgi:predicted ATPase/DNA-binding SARP family transcriptional activator
LRTTWRLVERGVCGIEFRVLGPVQATGDDGPLQLGAPKQRALLAFLLLNAEAVVSRDRLVDVLWGSEPPRSAVSSLQVYVHGLRRALGAERIETHGTGYLLRLDQDELDLTRFERLVERAAEALGSGRPADAAEDLRNALLLWGGSPLADLAGEPVGEAEAPHLEERRLHAIELLHDAELALGRHDELVPELERLIASEPYRERFRAQHVLALYRSGRQTDALDACRATRALLVEELGVDPGPELQALERGILQHDPSLAAPAAPAPPRVQLPIAPTPLVGRRLEIAAVTALLRRDDVRLVTLTGPGGAGKTRLSLAAAEELGRELRDGAVFVDLAPLRDPALLGPAIAGALGVTESAGPVDDQLAADLADKSMLLVLDNVEQLVPDVGLVSRLLVAAPRLLVLATSRSPLRLAGEQLYPVPPLELPRKAAGTPFEELVANDSVRLFAARAQAVDPSFELDQGNVGAVARICERLDGLPLAIELAAARSNLLPPEAMSRRLDQALDLLVVGARDLPVRQQTLRATLEWSYGLLDDRERTVFARLAVFAGGWTLDAAEAVCRDGSTSVLDALASLVDESLVRRIPRSDGEPRFAMLETIREYATELLAGSGEEETMRRKHCLHLMSRGEAVAAAFVVGEESDRFFDFFEEERDNVRAALAWAAEAGELELEVRLAVAARWFWLVRGHLSDGGRLFDELYERTAQGPKPLRALALVHGPVFLIRRGETRRADELWSEGLELCRELGDDDGAARCIAELGFVAFAEADYDRAVSLYEESVAIFREQGQTGRLAAALGNLGSIANIRSDREAAARYFTESIALSREFGDDDGLAVNLHNLARTELALRRLDRGRAGLLESLAIARRLGYREVIAYCLGGFAELAMLEDDPERAATMLGASRQLFVEVTGMVDGEEAEMQAQIEAYAVEAIGADRTDELKAAGAGSALDELLEDVASRA